MDVTKELIDRFFNKQCSATEAEVVVEYLRANPELIDEHLPTSEWEIESFEQVSEKDKKEMWDLINKETEPYSDRKLRKFSWVGIAASIIVLISVGYFINLKLSENKLNSNPKYAVKASSSVKEETVVNYTKVNKKVLLPDGSEVNLVSNSQIKFRISPNEGLRTVFLTGDAFFKVHRDIHRTFNVYAANITTTDLGTEFYVSNKEVGNEIRIKLFEGKVGIKVYSKFSQNNKSYFLIPGTELIYDKRTSATTIKSITTSNRKEEISQEPENLTIFNNDSLSLTLDQLSAIYNVDIKYPTDAVKGVTFIGTIKKSDGIDNVLRDIATANHLQFTKTGKVYILTRKN